VKTFIRGALVVTGLMATATFVLPAPAAVAEPATPAFGRAIDGYQPDDGAGSCDPTDKPGPVDLGNLLNAAYGTKPTGVSRPCEGNASEHWEGRALDWVVSGQVGTPADARQQQIVQRVIDWLLATDEYGNRHAMFRRLGLMYMIWNKQIWAGYKAGEGWRPYSCSGVTLCHQDHIHVSFGWDGAYRRTSWWAGRVPIAPSTAGTVSPIMYGSTLQVYARAIDNSLYQNVYDGTKWTWKGLGGVITSGPSAIVEGGFLRVFARGADNALWFNSWNGQSWYWSRVGGQMYSDPSAIAWGGRLRVFYRGANGHLYQVFHDGGWQQPQDLGFVLQSSPSAVNENGTLRVFARGNDGALWRISWEGDAWRSQKVGGLITSSPGAFMQGSQIFVFARGTDGALWRYTWTAASGWQTTEVGDTIASGPQAVMHGSIPRVFMKAPDNQLRQAFWANGRWERQSLGGYLA
jgi:hypothetical protein